MHSKVGWLISGGILLLVLMIVAALTLGGSLPAPSATAQPGALDKIEAPVDYKPLVDIPDGPGKAADLYKQAVTSFREKNDPEAFEKTITDNLNPQDDPQIAPALQLVKDAAKEGMGNTDLTFSELPPRPSSKPHDLAVETLCLAVGKAAASVAADKKKDEAEQLYDALFVLGYRLWKNGVYETDRTNGLAAMGAAADGLVQFYGSQFPDKQKAAAAKRLSESLTDARDKWMAKDQLVHSLNANLGDLYNMAKNDADRTWKLEALRWLGPLQWQNTSYKQRRILHGFFMEEAASPDTLIARTAKASANYSQIDARQF